MTRWQFGCDFQAWVLRMDKRTRGTMAARNNPDNDKDADAQGGGVQSVDRALQILEILAREGDAGVSEIAEEMGVHKSTVSRLVGSLVNRDLVRQNSERGKYQLGFGILRLASSIPGRLSVVHEAREVLEALAAQIQGNRQPGRAALKLRRQRGPGEGPLNAGHLRLGGQPDAPARNVQRQGSPCCPDNRRKEH